MALNETGKERKQITITDLGKRLATLPFQLQNKVLVYYDPWKIQVPFNLNPTVKIWMFPLSDFI